VTILVIFKSFSKSYSPSGFTNIFTAIEARLHTATCRNQIYKKYKIRLFNKIIIKI